MNETKQKIAKTSKMVAVVLKISFILALVAMGLLLLGMGFLAFENSSDSTSLMQTFTVAASGTSATGVAVGNLIISFGLGVISLATMFMVLFTLYRLFVNISKEHTPFTEVNVKIMKKVAVWTVITCFVDFIANGIADRILTGEVTFTFNFIWLVVAATIYGIALIFDYGCQLQQQSDETL